MIERKKKEKKDAFQTLRLVNQTWEPKKTDSSSEKFFIWALFGKIREEKEKEKNGYQQKRTCNYPHINLVQENETIVTA